MEEYNRRSIMNFLYLVTGNEQSDSQIAPGVFDKEAMAIHVNKKDIRKSTDRQEVKRMIYSTRIHPSVRRALEFIQAPFLEIFNEQNILIHPKRKEVVEKILLNRSPVLLERVRQRWVPLMQRSASSAEMYACIQEELDIYERFH